MTLRTSLRATILASTAALAVLPLSGGCAAEQIRTLDARAVDITEDDTGARLLVTETQYLARVPSPEGLMLTPLHVDLAFQLTQPGAAPMPLSFLDVHHADRLDDPTRVFTDSSHATWIAIAVPPSRHMEHVQGMQFKDVDDDFVAFRVKTFTRDRLVSQRDLRACNPSIAANPTIHFVRMTHAFAYCAKAGHAVYDPATNLERIVEAGDCCPSAVAGRPDGATRDGKDLVLLLSE